MTGDYINAYILTPALAAVFIVLFSRYTGREAGKFSWSEAVMVLIAVAVAFISIYGVSLCQRLYMEEQLIERVDRFVGSCTIIPDDTISHEAAED